MNHYTIPQDVKDAYHKFKTYDDEHDYENRKLDDNFYNKGRDYTIISKNDFNIYFFSKEHILLGRQKSLLWATRGNHQNDPSNKIYTTPCWFYDAWNIADTGDEDGENFLAETYYNSHYIIFMSRNKQVVETLSDWASYTIWMHWIPYRLRTKRKKWLKSNQANDREMTNWCTNVDPSTFGEVYNHIKLWSVIYITDYLNYNINN